MEYLSTELGPGLVTSIEQTILDLSGQEFVSDSEPRVEAVRNLMAMANSDRLAELAARVRGRAARPPRPVLLEIWNQWAQT